MKPLAISKVQLISWLIVTGVAFVLLMAGPGYLAVSALGIIGISRFILLTPSERSRQIPRKEVLLMVVILLGLIGFILALNWLVPKDSGEAAVRFVRHPAFVIPIWALSAWLVYRRWKSSQTSTNGHSAA